MAFNHTFKYLKSTSDGIKEIEENKNISASKAIRYYCMDCSGGNLAEVKCCGLTKCPLWPFRMGKGSDRPRKHVNFTPDSTQGANGGNKS